MSDPSFEAPQFSPFSSCVSPGFWSAFSKLKLETLRLDERPVAVHGLYANSNCSSGVPQSLSLDWDAAAAAGGGECGDGLLPRGTFPMRGEVFNLNTLDGFRSCDKAAFLDARCAAVWASVLDGTALDDPDRLNTFCVLMHADLKRFHYYYWFAFPAFAVPPELLLRAATTTTTMGRAYPRDACERVEAEMAERRAAFCFRGVTATSLRDGIGRDGFAVVFADPGCRGDAPGWPLRNLLLLVAHHRPRRLLSPGLEVICLRRPVEDSPIVTVRWFGEEATATATRTRGGGSFGWEANERGRFGPRFANMRSSMDPKSLAASSVNLNLKLMKWRTAPGLDLGRMTSMRCLVVGSGTLGCNIARCLLGWGVAGVTMVDGARVSHSNPVRQSLFAFRDCLDGGRHKAEAAASAIREIHPAVDAEGVVLTVPLPGHPISGSSEEEAEAGASCDRLVSLVLGHDVVFLGTDTRESRWLPTVVASAHGKLVVNAALGYDSYLVMRHGAGDKGGEGCDDDRWIPGHRLGCYFCNDVVAPGNSTRDRALDRQCTVTRPGVSLVAAGLAVELMASTVQHRDGASAPAPRVVRTDDAPPPEGAGGALGSVVPHSIRGSLRAFEQFCPATERFPNCPACGPAVLEAFRAEGFELVKKAANDAAHLEDLSGLSALTAALNVDDLLGHEFSDDAEEEDGGGGGT